MIDFLFQSVILIIALTYKYLFTKRNVWAWVLSAMTSIITVLYLYLYYRLPIVISLELCAMSLSFYGLFKHRSKLEALTKVDYTIIVLTIIAIVYFVLKQLEAKTTVYEIGASVVFLSGIVFMAQKSYKYQIIAWFLYNLGSTFMGIIYFQEGKWIIFVLHMVSIVIGIYAIRKILESKNLKK